MVADETALQALPPKVHYLLRQSHLFRSLINARKYATLNLFLLQCFHLGHIHQTRPDQSSLPKQQQVVVVVIDSLPCRTVLTKSM